MSDTQSLSLVGDVLTDGVHHHSKLRDRPRQIAGESVRTLCGITKCRVPDAWERPCCPMCAAVMDVPCASEVTA